MPGTLYIVATPIGNMEEMTPRALRILSEADVIAAEDTRNTGLMLSRLGVDTAKLISYHKFNEAARQNLLLEKLMSGQNIALVSDAGTPCISDPGFLLVKAAAEAGITIVGVSGSCAVTTALSVSGFPSEPFLFVGFLPRKAGAIIETIMPLTHAVQSSSLTLVFYESPKRIISTMELFTVHFPNLSLCLCNDLTKKFERTYRGSPEEVLEDLSNNPHAEKGEYTCIAYLEKSQKPEIEALPSLESQLIDIVIKSNCTMKEAINILSAENEETSKKEIYAASLRLKELLS